MNSTTHIAGVPVRIGSRVVQRCAWCGVVIDVSDLSRIGVAPNPDGSPGQGPEVTSWAVFHQVRIVEGNPQLKADLGTSELPEDSCVNLTRFED